jgi:hypothetical protein
MVSVILLVAAGLLAGFMALQVKFVDKNYKKLNQIQLVFDALLPYALGTLPWFLYIYLNQDPESPQFDNRQILLCNIALVLETIGGAIYAVALKYGKASRI